MKVWRQLLDSDAESETDQVLRATTSLRPHLAVRIWPTQVPGMTVDKSCKRRSISTTSVGGTPAGVPPFAEFLSAPILTMIVSGLIDDQPRDAAHYRANRRALAMSRNGADRRSCRGASADDGNRPAGRIR